MSQTTRTNVLEEVYDKDEEFISRRVHEILNTIPQCDRELIVNNYRDVCLSTKTSSNIMVLAGILENYFQQKFKGSPALTSEVHSISSPTMIEESTVTERRVGNYKFIKTLGKGTFGKVKLAQNTQTGQMAAIKIMEKSNIKTPKQRVSVQREVRLMKLLNHPHIVSAQQVYESKDHYWIVMEHASCGELFDHIVKSGMVKEPEARRFFRQILSAVEYCHLNSIIHRDLKPENLLLDSNLNIKIIDFGFGNTFHRDRLLDTYCGSPFYAAPEMIQGIRYVGPEVDVWSLGVIMFALLSGRLPFDAATMSELYEKIGKGRYACPPHFTPEAVHLISRMLEVDPRKRATLAEIKQHVWVNKTYDVMPNACLPHRPSRISTPFPESYIELMTYGFKTEDAMVALTTEIGLHPITSLYYLIEAARQRRVLAKNAEEESRRNIMESIDTQVVSQDGVDRIAKKLENVADKSRSCSASPTKSIRSSTPSNAPRSSSSSPSPRVTKGLLNYSTKSTLDYVSTCEEIERVLDMNNVTFERPKQNSVYACEVDKSTKFEIEVMSAPAVDRPLIDFSSKGCRGDNTSAVVTMQDEMTSMPAYQFDLHLRRVRGNLWTHKKVAGQVMANLNL